jgi:alkyldihydroxyacetonephosphate synthase
MKKEKTTAAQKGKLKKALAQIADVLGSEHVSMESTDLINYTRCLYSRSQLLMRKCETYPPPDMVAWPENTEQVSAVLKIANALNIPVTPYGAGSGVCGGAIPLTGGITLDLKRLNKIKSIDEKSLLVTVQAGMIGEVFERELNSAGYSLGHFPSSIYTSSVGGWLAARSAGQLSTKYGKIEDMAVAIQAVLPDGSIITTKTTPRSSSGPDLKQMIIGSEGTLAVITEAVLKIHRLPEKRIFQGWKFKSVPDALKAIRLVMRTDVLPAVVRLYDEIDTALTMTALGYEASGSLLIIAFEGATGMTELEASVVERICIDEGGESLGPEAGEHWWKHRYDISYNQSKILANDGMLLDTIEVATVWSNLFNLYESMRKALEPFGTVLAHFSHVYREGGSIYYTIIANDDEKKVVKHYDEMWKAAMDACIAADGAISHHHGIGILKAPWMKDELGALFDVYKKIKNNLDPNNILNPGKLGL